MRVHGRLEATLAHVRGEVDGLVGEALVEPVEVGRARSDVSSAVAEPDVSVSPVGPKNGLQTSSRACEPITDAVTGSRATSDVDASAVAPPVGSRRSARSSTPVGASEPTAVTESGAPRTDEANETG